MIYIVCNKETLGCYSIKENALNLILDYLINKFTTILEVIDISDFQFDINKLNDIKINTYELDTSNLYECINIDIDNMKFKNILNDEYIKIEDYSINNKLKQIKQIYDILNKQKFNEINSDSQIFCTSMSKTNSETIENNSLNSDKLTNLDYTNSDENDELEINEIKMNQNDVIKKLMDKKRKIEKIQEILRKFEIDYTTYNELKDKWENDSVPIIFKNAYEVLNKFEKEFDISNKNECKKYYIQNYNKVIENTHTSYNSLFNQIENESLT